MNTKEFNLNRFIEVQDNPFNNYAKALKEIIDGEKKSHWIWYIFPQMKGLGRSSRSKFYGIESKEEAEQYLAHPVLSQRLREISRALLTHKGRIIEEIVGGIDAIKVFSSMTLFDAIAPGDVFGEVLDAFYGGIRDNRTLYLLTINL